MILARAQRSSHRLIHDALLPRALSRSSPTGSRNGDGVYGTTSAKEGWQSRLLGKCEAEAA
jgi:hypothetical protein